MITAVNLLLWTTHLDEKSLPYAELLRDAGFEGVEVPVHQPDAVSGWVYLL